MRESPFIALLVISGLLHVAGLGGALSLLAYEVPQPVQKASIRVALGSSGRATGAIAQPRQTMAQARETPKKDTRPAEPPQQQERHIRLPRPPPEPEPALEDVLQPVMRPAQRPPPMRSPIEQQGQDGRSGRDGQTKTDTDGETDGEGYASLLARYDALVLGHLSQFKSYPARARVRGEQGDVAVEFQIDRKGVLLRSRILLTSDSTSLDSAAVKQMRDAEPYPQAPAEVRWQIRTYRTEMRYRLRE